MNYTFAYRRYSLPFHAPVRTAHGVWKQREGLIVRLEREDGKIGFGECAPIPWFGSESVDDAAAFCDSLGGKVSDEQIDALEAKDGCVRFALDSARDFRQTAQPEGLPYLPVAALLPAGSSALGKIPALAEAGFRSFKWKVGAGDAADELAILDDVLAALPTGARLRLDANGAWDRRVAERWLARCAECPVEFVEQPIAADARGATDVLLGLAGDYPTPIALDESVVRAGDVSQWLELGWPGIFVLKPSLLGDVAGTLGKLRKARAGGRVVFSSALETAIGARAALRVAFGFYAKADVPRALGFGVWPLFEDARCDGPHIAPFLRADDLNTPNLEALWNALN